MTEGIINATIKKLKRDLEQMDIPEKRKGDLLWLQRNLWIHNKGELVQNILDTIHTLVANGITKI